MSSLSLVRSDSENSCSDVVIDIILLCRYFKKVDQTQNTNGTGESCVIRIQILGNHNTLLNSVIQF